MTSTVASIVEQFRRASVDDQRQVMRELAADQPPVLTAEQQAEIDHAMANLDDAFSLEEMMAMVMQDLSVKSKLQELTSQ